LKDYGLDYVAVKSVDQLVEMLHLNRIDFYIDDEAAIFHAARRVVPADLARFHVMDIPFDQRKANNVMVSRAYPNSVEILKRFNAGLAQIKKTGEHAKILAKYHLQD
jgi:ABC-type amino acid transport substrate-binding protein